MYVDRLLCCLGIGPSIIHSVAQVLAAKWDKRILLFWRTHQGNRFPVR